MRPVDIALLLCLAADITVAAATPEQELQAEAQKLLTTMFTKCGDDYL